MATKSSSNRPVTYKTHGRALKDRAAVKRKNFEVVGEYLCRGRHKATESQHQGRSGRTRGRWKDHAGLRGQGGHQRHQAGGKIICARA